MKKIIALLLLIMGFLATPFVIGMMTEQRSQEVAEHYRQNPNINSIEISITRGLFHSEITSKVNINIPELQAQPIKFIVHQSLRQGPFLWGNDLPMAFGFADMQSNIEFSSEVQAQLNQAVGDIPVISLRTQLHYDGSQHSTLSMPEFTHLSKDDTHITVHPLNLEGHSNLPIDQVQGTLNWQGIELSKADNYAKLGQTISHTNLKKEGVLWTGDIDWNSKNIQWTHKQKTVQLNNITIQAKTLIDAQQRVSSTQSLSIAGITNQGIHYGPGKYTLAINHIPLSVLEKIDAMQQKISTLPIAQQEQAIKNMPFSMFNLLPDILAAELEITLHDASLITPDGEIKAAFDLTLLGLKKQDVMNFTKIKNHLRADLSLQFPKSLMTQANTTQINNLLQKGWLIEKNTMLLSTLHMADGVLTINDQTIPLPF